MYPTQQSDLPAVLVDRRQHQRFRIAAPALYEIQGIRRQAICADISSGGVLLKTDRVFPFDQRVRLWIDWPVILDNRCPLRLVIAGKTIRSDLTGTAISISRYEFKIRPRGAVPHAAYLHLE
jgi:hypothetical protein